MYLSPEKNIKYYWNLLQGLHRGTFWNCWGIIFTRQMPSCHVTNSVKELNGKMHKQNKTLILKTVLFLCTKSRRC